MSLLSLITGSHDLQQLIRTNTSNDILCLQFIFVNGSTINEVHLYLKSSNQSYLIGNVSINNQLTFTKCFSDIPANNWTLYVCDGALPQGSKTCSNPAVILRDISITGNISNSSSVSSSVMPTRSIGKLRVIIIKYNIMLILYSWLTYSPLFIDITSTTPPTTTEPDNTGIIVGSVVIVIIVTGVGIGKYYDYY